MHYVLLSSTGNMIDSYDEEAGALPLSNVSSRPSPTPPSTSLLSPMTRAVCPPATHNSPR